MRFGTNSLICGANWSRFARILLNCCSKSQKTSKKIVVDSCINSDLDHPDEYIKLALRHEVIHAFMFESGLDSETEHVKFPEDEIFVDWVAIQYPKIKKVFDELEI